MVCTKGRDVIDAGIENALCLMDLLEAEVESKRNARALVQSVKLMLRQIGFVNNRLSNLVSPGGLDDADPMDWLCMNSLYPKGAATAAQEGDITDPELAKEAIKKLNLYTLEQLHLSGVHQSHFSSSSSSGLGVLARSVRFELMMNSTLTSGGSGSESLSASCSSLSSQIS